ncbi:carbonic anhydrase [Tothia fuscella]|uniref:Carbonic anhydrase n=1 Tax=Tothia fuscella TaxID=1048955 RepID=A0A9P4TZI5_9PEZI|nr:carbonic anhydrase [Tothia fuscella]
MTVTTNSFDRILAGNAIFARRLTLREPELLAKTAKGQAPEVLWLGCADSRIPETTICDCKPGDIFVHRNIANILTPDDINSASVIEYAVGFVKVNRVMVCGHTKCGGANAAMGDDDLGDILNTWLEPMRALRRQHKSELDKLLTADAKANRLAELNVFRSLEVLKQNPIVQKAMAERGLTLHGLLYDIPAGELLVLEDGKTHVTATTETQHRLNR